MSQQMNRSLRGDPFWGVIQEGGPLQANEKTEAWQKYMYRLRATGRSTILTIWLNSAVDPLERI